jgi:hypothetical protein
MNVKHLGLIAVTAVVAAGLAGMSTSNAGAAVAAAPANCVIKTFYGEYLTAVGGGGRETDTIHSDATQIGAWERFALVPAGNGMVAIQTVDGHYLTAMGGGGWSDADPNNPAFHTDATRIQAWEEFTLVPVTDDPYNNRPFEFYIRTVHGSLLEAVSGGGREVNVLNTNDPYRGYRSEFQVICGL